MSYQNRQTTKKQKSSNKSTLNPFVLYKRLNLPPVNKNLLIIVTTLMLFGIVSVFSASMAAGINDYQNPLHFPLSHLLYVCIGTSLMLILSMIPFKIWEKFTIPISIIIILLIAATMVPGLGSTRYGATRWLTFLPIQPSELGKFACVLLMSSALCDAKTLFTKKIGKHAGLIGLMLLIIYLQPNMSMVLLLLFTAGAMLGAAGISLRIFGTLIAIAIPCLIYIVMSAPYRIKRINGWLNPLSDPQGMGFHIIQSWYAISSGGILGTGIGNSKQKLYYLPFGHTDFIFSVIAEELGFVGITVLICLFLAFIHIGFKIALRCEDRFGKLMAFGIVFLIGFQAFVNMCVAAGVFPVTGVTLPLISYGGSSLIATSIMLGVLFNISRYATKKERKNKNANQQQPQN